MSAEQLIKYRKGPVTEDIIHYKKAYERQHYILVGVDVTLRV